MVMEISGNPFLCFYYRKQKRATMIGCTFEIILCPVNSLLSHRVCHLAKAHFYYLSAKNCLEYTKMSRKWPCSKALFPMERITIKESKW
jgi:hypothetical protein